MRYSGSKRRFMKYLLPILSKDIDGGETFFIDFFGGGMNVISEIPHISKIAVDNNKYIIALWRELQQNGMKNIPVAVTEEEYYDIKKSYVNNEDRYEDYLVGYVGACCSYGGAWFNGYAKFNPKKNEDHIKEAYNGLKKQVENFKNLKDTIFIWGSYDNLSYLIGKNDIVYCDPPYASTKKYESDFDNDAFWEWVRNDSKKCKHMYVSEYEAPEDFKCVWQMKKKDGMGTTVTGRKQETKVEKLFVYDPK